MVARPRSRSLPILPSQLSQTHSMDPDGDFQFLMDLMSESSVYEHSSGSDRDSEPEHAPLSVQIHSLTANVYLDCPIEELVPARYVREAEKSPVVQRNVWVFRYGCQDARDMDLEMWSNTDIRYRGVFKALCKVPSFDKDLYDGGSEFGLDELFNKSTTAQGHVLYALLHEILEISHIRRQMYSRRSYFYLSSKLTHYHMDYMTGHHERRKDAPDTAGCISMDIHPGKQDWQPVIPLSTTRESESLADAMAGKVKIMLAHLLNQIRRLHPRGDKVPDQEVYLVGLHGSKLHILRAYFPGKKTSAVWCGKKELPLRSSPSEYDQRRDENCKEEAASSNGTAQHQTGSIDLSEVDDEPDLHTFRVLATREFDLWIKTDFHTAVKALVSLVMYLMSGRARLGNLQRIFERYPYEEENEDTDEETEEEREEIRKRIIEEQEQLMQENNEREEEEQVVDGLSPFELTVESDHADNDPDSPWWDWICEDDDKGLDIAEEYAECGSDPIDGDS